MVFDVCMSPNVINYMKFHEHILNGFKVRRGITKTIHKQ